MQEFITSAILGGLLWDSIKQGIPLTLDYLHQNAHGYTMSDPAFANLENLTQQLPEPVKESEEALISYIEEDEEWKDVRSQIQMAQSTNFSQNITGENAKGVQVNNLNTLKM